LFKNVARSNNVLQNDAILYERIILKVEKTYILIYL